MEGTPHIILGGRVVVQADVCLRGDLCRLPISAGEPDNTRTSITVGRYVLISTGSTLHPPHRFVRGGEVAYYPMKVGENVFIGAGCYIGAASVGSNVWIGKGAVVGNGCIIKDAAKVLEGSVLAAGMVVPSGVVVGGRPARILHDLPDGWGVGGANGRAGEWVEGGELKELIRSIK